MGRWTLSYPAVDGKRGTAMTVVGVGSGRWKVAQANVQMAPTDQEEGGKFDFQLRSLSAQNEVFSLLEVLVTRIRWNCELIRF